MARRAESTPAHDLADGVLERELRRTWMKRPKAVFQGDRRAVERLRARMEELEGEYATRHLSQMKADPWRTRAGSRARAGQKVDGGGAPREAARRVRARRARAEARDSQTPAGAGDGYERRQGRRRRQKFEAMQEGPAFARHTLGTTGERPPKTGSRRGRIKPDRMKERVENPDLVRRTSGKGRGAGPAGSSGRKGGTPTRNVSKKQGTANRAGGRGGRRPKSGAQG